MKTSSNYLLLAIFCLTTSNIYGQELLEFSHVIEVPGVPAETLFERAEMWALDGRISGTYEIQTSNAEKGLLVVTGSFRYWADEELVFYTRINGKIEYRLQIYCRDGRYKYVVSDFFHRGTVDGASALSYGWLLDIEEPTLALVRKPKKEVWDDLKHTANAKTGDLAKRLLQAMFTPTELETEW